eukprot:Opistho-1_new@3591
MCVCVCVKMHVWCASFACSLALVSSRSSLVFRAGRASAGPILDVFVTLLHLGSNGYKRLLKERKELYSYFVERMGAVAAKHGERMLSTTHNPISFAMTLGSLGSDATMFGSMLFSRCVSGTRVVDPRKPPMVIEGHSFAGFGAHYDEYPTPYLTAAAALGITREDIDTFVDRLDRTLAKAKAQRPNTQTDTAT